MDYNTTITKPPVFIKASTNFNDRGKNMPCFGKKITNITDGNGIATYNEHSLNNAVQEMINTIEESGSLKKTYIKALDQCIKANGGYNLLSTDLMIKMKEFNLPLLGGKKSKKRRKVRRRRNKTRKSKRV